MSSNSNAESAAALNGTQGRYAGLSGQFFRYGIVGVSANAAAYLAYLGLTALGIEPKAAMTLVFAATVLSTFLVNRTWSFRSTARHGKALVRYFAVYWLGYVVNWLGLGLLVDAMGYPHQLVQLMMIVLVAALMFVALHLWVFK